MMNIEERAKILKDYNEARKTINELEAKCKLLRPQVLKIGIGVFGDYQVCIEKSERESFDWKLAKVSLSVSVISKLLPFVEQKEIETVRVIAVKK